MSVNIYDFHLLSTGSIEASVLRPWSALSPLWEKEIRESVGQKLTELEINKRKSEHPIDGEWKTTLIYTSLALCFVFDLAVGCWLTYSHCGHGWFPGFLVVPLGQRCLSASL